MSNSRGLDTLLQAVADNNVIVPNKDVPIVNNDRFTCRIIKFGKVNDRKYKDDETGEESTSKCLRIYLHLYEFFSAEDAKIDDGMSNTVITINPKLQWLSEITATQVALEEMTGNKEEIFRHKFMLRRKDRLSAANNKYGYIEVKDLGVDPLYDDTDDTHERVADIDAVKPATVDNKPATAAVTSATGKKPLPAQPASQATTAEYTEKLAAKSKEKSASDKCVELLAKATTIEQALEYIKPIYGAVDKADPERAKIMAMYTERKEELAKELIEAAGSDGCVAKALELTTKFFAKEPDKSRDLNKFAANIALNAEKTARGVVESDELSEDDIPF